MYISSFKEEENSFIESENGFSILRFAQKRIFFLWLKDDYDFK